MKVFVAAMAAAFALATPVFAQDAATVPCDQATIDKVQAALDAATDPAMKATIDTAKVDLKAASDALAANNAADCSTNLKKVTDAVPAAATAVMAPATTTQ